MHNNNIIGYVNSVTPPRPYINKYNKRHLNPLNPLYMITLLMVHGLLHLHLYPPRAPQPHFLPTIYPTLEMVKYSQTQKKPTIIFFC